MKQIFTLLLGCLFSLSLSAQTVQVTFAVDMAGQDADAAFVAGQIQDPEWTPGDGALTDADANGVWTRTYELEPGDYLYKFGIGNDWGNNEGGGLADCGVDDGTGGFNRTINVPAGSDPITVNFVYNSCEMSDREITAGPEVVAVTFAVDVSGVDPAPDAMFVAGAFQEWMPMNGALEDADENGVWSRTYNLEPGDYQYKFGIGNDWGMDENSVGDCGADGNRVITVALGQPDTVNFVYNSCTMSDNPIVGEVMSQPVEVIFSVDANDLDEIPDTMFVAGSFQGWTPEDGYLSDADENGIFRRTYTLEAGQEIQYKFGIGPTWGNDEGGEGIMDCSTDNNRTATIPADATETVYLSFKFNSCEAVDVTSTDDVSTLGRVSLAPNPMGNSTRISFENATNAGHDVFVTNMAGQIVRSYRDVRGNQLDVERGNLVAGLYFVTFRNSAGEQGSLKLMVQ